MVHDCLQLLAKILIFSKRKKRGKKGKEKRKKEKNKRINLSLLNRPLKATQSECWVIHDLMTLGVELRHDHPQLRNQTSHEEP